MLLADAAADQDAGVKKMAQLSARLAYAMMCLTLCWGVLIATGWAQRLTGRQELRNGHMVLATAALAFGSLHAVAFTLLQTAAKFSFAKLVLPFLFGGFFRHGLGIVGLELMFAIAITAGLRRKVLYRRWLRFHQLAYAAVTLTVVHSWLGAVANGNLAVLWLAGLTILIPTATIAAARFAPPETLARLGLVERTGRPQDEVAAEASVLDVSVNNERCHRYGICMQEAPEVFDLIDDDRLTYERRPHPDHYAKARAAARACPMRAIELRERVR
ncbi:ferric reductase-like transmembrane domain-containing protein [Umezawaea beigongshangensis]|uniref:ferric reductase-like transmembrane domain-containing protein n=1 Tax=Umezawaea beigongshangensis TaxID=2780383 RepID=UPI0018F1DE85|nr:ferric reductase-like transmembrane domain-containing protein [Umezawaea beigongshangensis]